MSIEVYHWGSLETLPKTEEGRQALEEAGIDFDNCQELVCPSDSIARKIAKHNPDVSPRMVIVFQYHVQRLGRGGWRPRRRSVYRTVVLFPPDENLIFPRRTGHLRKAVRPRGR